LILLIPSVMAERFLYLPLVGFAGCIGLTAYAIHQRLDNRSWLQPAVWFALGIVVLIYGIRAHLRNFDWHDDLSIRTRGVEVNPRSFRVHYALAKTLYESDAANLDRAISEAETAQAILERSAPPSFPIPAYVLQDLGVYYEAKARLLESADSSEPEILSWRRKAAESLERATAWYRIANEEHRQIELSRGRHPDEIMDVGVATVHSQLGAIYQRLGQRQETVTALTQARHLAPRDADVHEALSAAYAALGRTEDAIVSLLQAFMFDQGRQSIWTQLVPLYDSIDPGGCAFTRVGDEYRFDNSCPIARRHICEAFRRQVEVFRAAHLWASADEFRQNAQRDYGCMPNGPPAPR
jgi:tetratricopeptide (TPR) repeat protein